MNAAHIIAIYGDRNAFAVGLTLFEDVLHVEVGTGWIEDNQFKDYTFVLAESLPLADYPELAFLHHDGDWNPDEVDTFAYGVLGRAYRGPVPALRSEVSLA